MSNEPAGKIINNTPNNKNGPTVKLTPTLRHSIWRHHVCAAPLAMTSPFISKITVGGIIAEIAR
jgi:hypothetical protein